MLSTSRLLHIVLIITKATIVGCGQQVKWVPLAKSLRPKAWGVPFHNLVKPSIFEDKLDFSTNLNNCPKEFYLSLCFLIKNCNLECNNPSFTTLSRFTLDCIFSCPIHVIPRPAPKRNKTSRVMSI